MSPTQPSASFRFALIRAACRDLETPAPPPPERLEVDFPWILRTSFAALRWGLVPCALALFAVL